MLTTSVTLTPEQEKYLRSNYHAIPRKKLAEELGLTVPALDRDHR